ncbi:MAG: ABC transporter ATP-binding protein [Gammaproteobacteria bacterium]|nr:ABC transporter ATP-binding protein [Gammaproteobacteria bacterium]
MSISLEQVSKHYDGAAAISDVSADIADGEFFVLLGPSGSGKSTLLRAIAGLTTIDRGRIVLHGRDVTHVSAREREVGIVFQNYALFKHMSVADNIEFALRARGVRAAERRRRREELLELVALPGLGERLPAELSGGQQQRVAVARALAHEPRVLLLDEPFGALDARIREDLRRAIRQIQRTVGITAILVTHDQEEAFTMADRIGVMDRGRLQETDEPRVLYSRPRTRFVATFLGAANVLLGRHEQEGVRIGHSLFEPSPFGRPSRGAEATVVIRPEDLALGQGEAVVGAEPLGRGKVEGLEFVGVLERVRLSVAASTALASAQHPDAKQFLLEASRSAREAELAPLQTGQNVSIGVKRVHVLPTPIGSLRMLAASSERIEQLAASPVIRELAARMHVRPVGRVVDGDAPIDVLGGLPVVEIERDQGLAAPMRLLEIGAHQVLGIADSRRPIDRLLIYVQPTRSAREAALGAAATLLRHLAVDATLLVPAHQRRSLGGSSYRDLLDLRHSALRGYGVDVRTESFDGLLAEAIRNRAHGERATLLLLGVTSNASARGLLEELGPALALDPPAAALIVRGTSVSGAEGASIPYVRQPAAASAFR